MKRYVFTERKENNRGYRVCRIYRVKNNQLSFVAVARYNIGSCRGAVSECFNALMECGEIPEKYKTSSKTAWSGEGYFFGDVTKLYDIAELY